MASVSMTTGMCGAVVHLLPALHNPAEAAVMGEAKVHAVVFEELKREQGAAPLPPMEDAPLGACWI